jgi:hypothetical protein
VRPPAVSDGRPFPLLNGNIGSSTFRFLRAALFVGELDLQPFLRGTKVALSASDNARLSAWQREQLLLTWCTRARPWVRVKRPRP